MAAEQVEAVQPDGAGVEEVVADKGYHSNKTLVGFAVTYRSRSEVSAAGRTKRRGRRRRRSVLHSRRCMGTAVVFVERGAFVYKGGVARWWSGLSRTSTKPGVCVGFVYAAMRMSASGCSSRRPAATLGCCCAA